MLLYLCTFRDDPDALPTEGLASEGEPFRLHRSLETALAVCAGAPGGRDGHVLVLDAARLDLHEASEPAAHRVPRESVLNLGPYRPPQPIVAAGGYVVRRPSPSAARGPRPPVELLLIFRRGAWDLPKGKLDRGETPEQGALREVSEEVGVPDGHLALLGALGPTLHGYALPAKKGRPARYAVKTTHWFAMATTATAFRPQAEEDIEAVAWVPWAEAGARLGFESLRRHHAALDPEGLGI